MSSANIFTLDWIPLTISLIKAINRMGPNTLPCGIPEITSDHSEQVLLTITLCFLPVRKSFIQFNSSPCKPKLFTLVNNHWGGTLSKALAKSRYIQS